MAKKVRKDGERKEEKKVVFEEPEFDEREYLSEQLHSIRSTLFFIILAIPMGAAWAYTAIATGSSILGMVVSFGGYFVGVQILKFGLGVDLLEGPKRVLATTFLMYLFTSLAFSVLLSNPPVNDVTSPSITDVVVSVQGNDTDDADWYELMRHRKTMPLNSSNVKRLKDNPDQKLFYLEEGAHAITGDNISILIRAGDAGGIDSVLMEHTYQSNYSAPMRMGRVNETRWKELGLAGDYYLWGEHYYEWRMDDVEPGNLYFRITVTDTGGLSSVFETRMSGESIYIRNA